MKRFVQLLFVCILSSGLLTATASEANAISLAIPDSDYFSVMKKYPILTIAHRGYASHAPENTIPAFDRAVDLQADAIELDIQMTKDGELVVLHDSTVNRTTNGKGAVKDFTLAELRTLDAGQKFNPAFTGTTIPTLDEVLTRFGGKVGLLIELKVPSRYLGIEQKLAALLQQHKLNQAGTTIIVQSFDSRSLALFHQYAPDVPTGVLIDRIELLNEGQLLKYAAFAEYINPNKKFVTPLLVDQLHELGVKVAPWTARSAQDIAALIETGVDAVITDDPFLIPKP